MAEIIPIELDAGNAVARNELTQISPCFTYKEVIVLEIGTFFVYTIPETTYLCLCLRLRSKDKGLRLLTFDYNVKNTDMNISVNNKPVATEATTLLALSEELHLPEKGVAVAISNQMIPRSEWASTAISEGTSIIIIKAACGG